MRASVALLLYALTMATLGGAWLRRAHWPERAPRLGVLAWQSLSWSILAAVTLAGLVLAVPVSPVGPDLATVLDTCAMLLRQQYSTPGGVTAGVVGVVLTLGVTARVALVLAQSFWAARNVRVHQHQRLGLVARADTVLGVLVLDHSACVAYCLPGGGRGRVVVTTAALAVLDDAQIAAVLAHERAHLSGRHHLVNQVAAGLRAALPFVPTLRFANVEIAQLTEMIADDTAVRRGADRLGLATALVRLAESQAPAGALGAGGSTAIARVRRLVRADRPVAGPERLLALVGVVLLATAPLAVAAAPAVAVASSGYCPVSLAG
ncbi:M56 family metallopeptidase [Nocardioides sp. InS609-2]|uniref:M56 family metallopeptidase n=1 Tax=Nocardioides sp. InS609-2 TaxID=2760705 RepID=UPI0020BE6383|nr:M56 family metallopeptidase [Nocardioides sp. InS609-2]